VVVNLHVIAESRRRIVRSDCINHTSRSYERTKEDSPLPIHIRPAVEHDAPLILQFITELAPRLLRVLQRNPLLVNYLVGDGLDVFEEPRTALIAEVSR